MANDKIQKDIVLGVNSESIELRTSTSLSMQVTWETLTAGSPTLDITVSNDNVNFISLLIAAEAMDVVGDSFMLLEPSSPYLFIRVETSAGGSTGTYSIYFNKGKND